MTSQINPSAVNDQYPIAGQPNNTQGFRDNFAGTKTNFEYAAEEITELQTKSILNAALDGGSALTTQNNMLGAPLIGAKIRNFSADSVNIATTSGPITVDYSQGHYQRINTTGNISLGFTNWPSSGSYGKVRIQTIIDTPGRTMTLSPYVNLGTDGIQGYANSAITFSSAGTYQFDFSTSDGGGNITIFDLNRPLDAFGSQLHITNTSNSTSTTTGALIVDGGVGIAGNINIGGDLISYSGANVVFRAYAANGFVQINAPSVPANSAGALSIVGSGTGNTQPVVQAGGMLHITGNDGVSSRITNDAFGTGAQPTIIGRRGRGTAASPTVPQNNDVLLRFTATGWNGTAFGPANVASTVPCGVDFVAKETYSGTAQGSEIQFYNAPIGSNVRTLSATISSNVATFPSVVSVTGNVVSTGNILAIDGGTIGYNNGAGGTVTQGGNKSTGVTLNKPSGEITMASTNLAADTTVQFTLTNSTISAKDLLLMNIVSGAATGAAYNLDANCSAGSAVISVRNITGGALGEAIVLRYAVIRGSTT